MRAWFSTAVLAWVTAVLVTSPVLAAQSCLACCAERTVSVRQASCPHCPVGRAAATASLFADDNCHGCPKCEAARPVPATPVSVTPAWQPSELFVATLPVIAPPAISPTISAALSESLAGRASSPPLQILYCTWLN